jgi:hypothetical protein
MDPIDAFFANYTDFPYDRCGSSPREFYRMCDHFQWNKNAQGDYPQDRKDAHNAFRKAMVESFNAAFGQDINNINTWETMCHLLQIDPIPSGIQDMKNVTLPSHYHLFSPRLT